MKTIGWVILSLALFVSFPVLGQETFELTPSLVPTDNGLELQVAVAIPPGHYLYVSDTSAESLTEGVVFEVLQGLESTMKADPFLDGEVAVYPTSGTMRFRVVPQVASLKIRLNHWGCNETTCFLPVSRELTLALEGVAAAGGDAVPATGEMAILPAGLAVAGRAGGYLGTKAFIGFLDGVESGEGGGQDLAQDIMARYGVVLGVLVLLGFGFLLNLTPCVLPMIPVNIAIIGAGVQAGSRSRGLLLGGIYGLGMSLTYGILGLVVVLTGSQFGTLNASPWFNGAIAVLFVVMSLAMFGVFELDLSRFQRTGTPGGGSGRGPALTAFAMGSVAALLAGACVAPVLISVLVMATNIYQAGNPAGLLLPFVLGMGMGLPWPIVGAGFAILPKPGNWMVRVRAGFGVIILAAALFYGVQAIRLVRGASQVADAEGLWLHDFDEAVATAQEQGKPLFVDLWATWCKSCVKMNKTTFKDPAVLARLEPYVLVKVQAEDPRAPETKALLDALGAEGLPHYAVIQTTED